VQGTNSTVLTLKVVTQEQSPLGIDHWTTFHKVQLLPIQATTLTATNLNSTIASYRLVLTSGS
jgi:hypothetical protein